MTGSRPENIPRLDSWTLLADGTVKGTIADGGTLWIPRATSESLPLAVGSQICAVDGSVYVLGDAEWQRESTSSWYDIMSSRPNGLDRFLAFAGNTWPTLMVFAILTVSNVYGTVPGTCLAPMPTGRAPAALSSPPDAVSAPQGREGTSMDELTRMGGARGPSGAIVPLPGVFP